MRKLLIIYTMIIIIGTIFTGCNDTQTSGAIQTSNETPVFTLVEIPIQTSEYIMDACYFYKDPVTDVVYMQYQGHHTDGGLTVLLDPDTGLPLKYDKFSELYGEYIY